MLTKKLIILSDFIPDDYSSLLRSGRNCMIKSRAELFAEINVTPPPRTVTMSQLKGKKIYAGKRN
jgi:hypothetical protein